MTHDKNLWLLYVYTNTYTHYAHTHVHTPHTHVHTHAHRFTPHGYTHTCTHMLMPLTYMHTHVPPTHTHRSIKVTDLGTAAKGWGCPQ